ncbi:uncharacterized protein LOC142625351 [Castanea sativa]|uniref:uncharacterized protein LOC142625351 n=1 Tax=Castanea sativa TaxID=21020 RepID=UPI003F64CD83
MTAALNRFISRSADRCRPFFQCTEEYVLAFEELKQYLSHPPVLSRLEKEEVLYTYLAIMDYAVSLVLVRNECGVQRPIYYVSKSLQVAETRYLPLEKVMLAIVHATRKLPHYFQAHTMMVLTQLPLQALLRRLDYMSRIVKWGTILGAYDIRYMPPTTIKGQVLVDFVAEGMAEKENGKANVMTVLASGIATWEVYTNRVANQKGARVGIVLTMPEKLMMEKSLRLGFLATNNKAEYEVLLAGIAMVDQLRGEVVELYSDSWLVVGQFNGDFEARDERMQGYLAKVRQAQVHFKSFTLKQIPRGQNSHADSLAMLATSLRSNFP